MSRTLAFEGADLTGKTSVIAALQKRMPYAMWPVLRIHSSKQALREHDGASVNLAGMAFYSAVSIMAKTMPVILDRCYITNYVYGRVFDRSPDAVVLESVARKLKPVIIYLYTPERILLERLKWRGDDFINSEHLLMVAQAYREWKDENPFGDEIYEVATHVKSLEGIVDEIDEILQRVRA